VVEICTIALLKDVSGEVVFRLGIYSIQNDFCEVFHDSHGYPLAALAASHFGTLEILRTIEPCPKFLADNKIGK
jgi:hypothetical protein